MDGYVRLYYAIEDYNLRVEAEERTWRHRQLRQEVPIKLPQRLLSRIGDLLVRSGEWLHERFCIEPACA